MLFGLIRVALGAIIFLFSFLLIQRSRICHKRTWIVSAFIVTIALAAASAFIPVEDTFVTFSSAEKAYHYNHSGSVMLEVSGKKTSFLVGKRGNAYEYAIIPKVEHGWKLGLGADIEQVGQIASDGVFIQVYKHKKSEECFIVVQAVQGGMADISDMQNSEFLYLEEKNRALNNSFYTYYAYIGNLNDEYALTVNGVRITPCQA